MVLRRCHFFPGFSHLKLRMSVVAGFIIENILEKDKQGTLAKMGCRCCLCEVIFLQVTQADFHSLPPLAPSPSHPCLHCCALHSVHFFSFFLSNSSTPERFFSLDIPTPDNLVYVFNTVIQQIDFIHLILHTVSSVTYFVGSSSPHFLSQ